MENLPLPSKEMFVEIPLCCRLGRVCRRKGVCACVQWREFLWFGTFFGKGGGVTEVFR